MNTFNVIFQIAWSFVVAEIILAGGILLYKLAFVWL